MISVTYNYYLCNVRSFEKKTCSPVKHQEVLVLKKLLASVYQVFIFGPRGFFSSSIVSMTAGRDSRSLTTAFSKHCAPVKWPLHLIPFYSLAVSVKIRQSREELTRQPEQHHRVVILQPPPSLDGGLDSQSVFLRVWFFNCPTKAMLLYLCNGDSSRALFPKTYKTRFTSKQEIHIQDVICINFYPCSNSWKKIMYAVYCYFTFTTRNSIFCIIQNTELGSFLMVAARSEAYTKLKQFLRCKI